MSQLSLTVQAVHAYVVTAIGNAGGPNEPPDASPGLAARRPSGAASLSQTDVLQVVEGLVNQTRRPDYVTLVSVGEVPAEVARRLRESFGDSLTVVRVPAARNFGDALRQAMTAPETQTSSRWLWLLHDDSRPEPDALSELLNAASQGATIGVVGPKQVDWSNRDEILELGIEATRTGRRVPLGVHREIDQGQYDGRVDVLAVGTAGMLVRADVWAELRGFDPILGPFGDGLEFGRRARRAGYRVVVAPKAVVAHMQRSLRPASSSFGRRRSAQMYNWMLATPPGLSLILFPLLLLWVPIRALGRLVTRQPVYMAGELSALATVFASIAPAQRGRRRDAATAIISRGQLASLEATPRTLEARRRYARRVARFRQRPSDFVDAATWQTLAANRRSSRVALALTLVVATVSSLYFWYPFLPGIRGGNWGEFPLTQASLWQQAWSAWVYGGVGAPGPVNSLLPVFSLIAAPFSLFGLSASGLSILILALVMPLAAFAAWALSGAFTRIPWKRSAIALLWAFQPALLLTVGIADLSGALLWIALPLAVLGLWMGIRPGRIVRVESVADTILESRPDVVAWGAVGACAGAVASSGSPIVAPLLLVLGIALAAAPRQDNMPVDARLLVDQGDGGAGREQLRNGAGRYLVAFTAWIPAAAISAPTLVWALARINTRAGWLALLIPNGAPAWPAVPVWVWLPALLLVAIAVAGVFSSVSQKTGWAPIIILLAAVGNLWLLTLLPEAITGLSPFISVALLLAFLTSLQPTRLRAGRWQPREPLKVLVPALAAVASATAYVGVLVVGPLAFGNPYALEATGGQGTPLISQQTALSEEAGRTLVLTDTADGVTIAQLRREGALTQMDLSLGLRYATLDTSLAAEESLASAVGQLAARPAPEAPNVLAQHGVALILLQTGGPSGVGTLEGNLDSTDGLERIGTTEAGTMWRVRVEPGSAVEAQGVTGREFATSHATTLVLAEPAAPFWQASFGGEPLEAAPDPDTEAGWRQAFAVPTGEGILSWDYSPVWLPVWKWGTLAVLAAGAVFAVPWRRKSAAWFGVGEPVPEVFNEDAENRGVEAPKESPEIDKSDIWDQSTGGGS